MERHALSAFATILLLLFTAGCKSDQEKTRETLESFAEAVVVHRAPYHAYVHLDPEDKQHISVEAYATGFSERETAFPPGTMITIGDVALRGDRAESVVTITAPDGESETRKYVLRLDGTRWRVWLGLSELESMREKLNEARRLADDGALEEAKERLEEVATANFKASRPEIIEGEVVLLRQSLTNKARFAELDARFKEAMKADVATMRREARELSKTVGPDDEAFYPRLEVLLEELDRRAKEEAIANFNFEDVRARSFRDSWGTFREVRFKTTNNTGRALSKLAIRLDLINENDEAPVGSVVWQLIEEGNTFPSEETLEVKREVQKAPKEWDGEQVAVSVEELQFVDGGTDDAG